MLQYQLIHPDLRPGASHESDQRFHDISVLGCPVMKSHVSKEERSAKQFGQNYVKLAMLLADTADCQVEIDKIDRQRAAVLLVSDQGDVDDSQASDFHEEPFYPQLDGSWFSRVTLQPYITSWLE